LMGSLFLLKNGKKPEWGKILKKKKKKKKNNKKKTKK